MSLILDALNRSEKERSTGDTVPGLATEHYLDETATGPAWRQYLPWLALLVALLVIGWLVWDRLSERALPEQPSPVSPAPIAPAPGQGTPAAATPTEELAQADAPAATRSTAPPATKPALPAQPAADSEPTPADPSVSPDVVELYQQGEQQDTMVEVRSPAVDTVAESAPEPVREAPAPTVMTDAASEQDLDLEALVTRAENELENARLAEHSAPFLGDLSQQKKNQIPTLMYSRHDYSSDSKVSAVTINGKSLRAGGSAGGGVKVVEVLPDSVVLSHQGTEFRLRALNSWVNL